MECIFCSIVEGAIPSSKVYEDEHVLAFMDIAPISRGHTLIIPKVHCRNVLDTPLDVAEKIYPVIVKVSNAVRKAFSADGVSVIQSNESAAGQEVFHSHIHIIPRYDDDGVIKQPARMQVEISEIVQDCNKIRAEF